MIARSAVMAQLRQQLRAHGKDITAWPHPATLAGRLRQAITQLQVDLVLDVGAYHGWYVDMLRREVGYRGPVVSFEPNPDALRILRPRAEHDPLWEVRPVALGDKPGRATLQVYETGNLSSLHDQSNYARVEWKSEFGAATPVEVQVTTLADELLRPQGSTLLLKVDTQGHDLAVLAGSDLERIRLLQVEVPQQPLYEGVPSLVPFLDRVIGFGFDLIDLFPCATEAHLGDPLRVVEFDALFCRH